MHLSCGPWPTYWPLVDSPTWAVISQVCIMRPSSSAIRRTWHNWQLRLPWLQRLNRIWQTQITGQWLDDYSLSLIALTILLMTLLSGCATPRPVAVACPKPQISPELLQPPERSAQTDLLNYLQQLPPS